MYSRLQRRFPLVRAVFGTPYRAARIGERFYRTTQRAAPRGVAFWIVLSALYCTLHFFLIAMPTAKGHSNLVVLSASGAASPSEFAILVLALWLPALPTGLIVSDVLFQLLVLCVSLAAARCSARNAAPRIGRLPPPGLRRSRLPRRWSARCGSTAVA